MNIIKAYIRPELLEEAYMALRRGGFSEMTVFEGEGTGRFSDPRDQHGSLDFPAMHTKVVNIEIVVRENNIENVVRILRDHCCTGNKGDGIVFVLPVEKAVRIRDGETGPGILG